MIEDDYVPFGSHGSAGQQAIFAVDEDDVSVHTDFDGHQTRKVALENPFREVVLTVQEKIDLAKPMVLRYMLPLFLVFAFEYIINAVSTAIPEDADIAHEAFVAQSGRVANIGLSSTARGYLETCFQEHSRLLSILVADL